MEPLTVTMIGSALFFLLDRARDKKAANAAKPQHNPALDPPKFTQAQIERVTHVVGNTRHLDRELADKTQEALERYSAVPIALPELATVGRVWAIIPRMPGAENASALYARMRRDPSATILASYTLLLPERHPAQKLLLVGGPHAAMMCAPVRSPDGKPAEAHFAVIPPPPLPVQPMVAPPNVESVSTPAPAPAIAKPVIEPFPSDMATPAPESKKNGAPKKRYETPIVVDIAPPKAETA